MDEKGQARFRQSFRERFEGDPSKSSIYKDVSKGIAPAGIEYYLPLFFERTDVLFDYLPSETTLCLHHEMHKAIGDFTKDAVSRYNLLRGDPQRPLLETHELFLDAEQFFICVKDFVRVDIVANQALGDRLTSCPTAALPDIAVNRRAEIPTQSFQNFLQSYPGRVLLLADSLGRREIISGFLNEYGLKALLCDGYATFMKSREKFVLGVANLQNGFILTDEKIAIITESELYAIQARSRVTRAAKKSNVEGMLRDLSELKPGDPVVHELHGIARYHGLINIDLGEGRTNSFCWDLLMATSCMYP